MYGNLRYVISYQSCSQSVDYLKCVLLNYLAEIRVRAHQTEQYTILVKILTVMIMAHSGRAECCLNWNIYKIGVYCEF